MPHVTGHVTDLVVFFGVDNIVPDSSMVDESPLLPPCVFLLDSAQRLGAKTEGAHAKSDATRDAMKRDETAAEGAGLPGFGH